MCVCVGGGGQVEGGGGQGGCEPRIEEIVEIQKKVGGGGRGPVWDIRVDVNQELKKL